MVSSVRMSTEVHIEHIIARKSEAPEWSIAPTHLEPNLSEMATGQ